MYPNNLRRVRKDWGLAKAGYTQIRTQFLLDPSAWLWAWFLETFVARRAIRERNKWWSGQHKVKPLTEDQNKELVQRLNKLFKECRR